MSQIEKEILRVVTQRGVAYQRELQVALEDDYSHWDTYNALRQLVSSGGLGASLYKGFRWYFPSSASWNQVVSSADHKADLAWSYSNHENRFQRQGVTYMDYSEYLVEIALRQAGYIVLCKDTYYFNGRAYTRPDIIPGRPRDLDFTAYLPERRVGIGVQIKNRLHYPGKEDIDFLLEMCTHLGIKPLLVVRMAPEKDLARVVKAGGRVVVFKRLLLRPPFDRQRFREILSTLNLPISVYTYAPDFLVDKLSEAKDAFLGI